jgi:hypothetical protein
MLAAVLARCPALLPLAIWAYKQPSRLLVHQAPGVIIHSQSGLRQGDPLGPLLFALALQGPLEQDAEMDLARPLAYAADPFLQSAPEPTIRAFHALVTLAEPLGLQVQLAKCAVYFADTRAVTSVASQLCVRHAPDGLLAAGTPVGTPAYQAAQADHCTDRACILMDDFHALPLADQDRWILLQGSLQRRVAHLPRGCQCTHAVAAVQRAESKAVDGVFAMLGLPRVEGPLTAQITRPLCHGGLGLSHTCPIKGSAAYLSASAITHQAMRHGPEAFQPFDGTHKTAKAPRPACFAALAVQPRPGSTRSPSPGPLSSRVGKSALASATALASACCPLTPLPCSAPVAHPSDLPMSTMECGASPSLHIPRCAMTS